MDVPSYGAVEVPKSFQGVPDISVAIALGWILVTLMLNFAYDREDFFLSIVNLPSET